MSRCGSGSRTTSDGPFVACFCEGVGILSGLREGSGAVKRQAAANVNGNETMGICISDIKLPLQGVYIPWPQWLANLQIDDMLLLVHCFPIHTRVDRKSSEWYPYF